MINSLENLGRRQKSDRNQLEYARDINGVKLFVD